MICGAAQYIFQFTPLREGRPRGGHGGFPLGLHISIHAPPRGATAAGRRITRLTIFQFTPLREGRRRRAALHRRGGQISIHAPPRGATGQAATHTRRDDISIHAPPRGATESHKRQENDTPGGFQFTPLREGRRDARGQRHARRYFNSRPSARGDRGTTMENLAMSVFQFTPLREGRRKRRKKP